jgi:hypothetical protein
MSETEPSALDERLPYFGDGGDVGVLVEAEGVASAEDGNQSGPTAVCGDMFPWTV